MFWKKQKENKVKIVAELRLKNNKSRTLLIVRSYSYCSFDCEPHAGDYVIGGRVSHRMLYEFPPNPYPTYNCNLTLSLEKKIIQIEGTSLNDLPLKDVKDIFDQMEDFKIFDVNYSEPSRINTGVLHYDDFEEKFLNQRIREEEGEH